MSPKERRTKIFEYLKTLKNWVIVDDISKNFNVSERTVYNDLNRINKELEDTRWVIEKKRGVGIRLNTSEDYNQNDIEDNIEISDDRIIKILRLLLIDDRVVTFESLSQLLFISVSSIRNDLEVIKKLLKKNTNVELYSDNQGTKIVGEEIQLREALVWFNQYVIENQNLINQSNLNNLKIIFKQLYNDMLVEIAYNILFGFVKKNNNLLSDYYILNTLNVYIVQLHRLTNHYYLEDDNDYIQEIDYSEEINTVDEFTSGSKELLNRASSRLSFHYTENESNYLAKYLIINRLENIPMDAKSSDLIVDLMKHLSDTLNVDLNKDMQLKQALMQHVPPMLYRLKLNIKSENPFVNQIKNEFGETFYIIKLAIEVFEDRLHIKFNDEEVALLTVYFQSAIERKRKKRKILVVCQHGLAMSGLLVNRLENVIPTKVNIESASVGELNYYDLNDYDLVVSTVSSLEGENVLKISTFLQENDIDSILNRLSIEDKEHHVIGNSSGALLNFLEPEYIIIDSHYEDKEDLIHSIINQLLEDKYINKKYLQSVLQRETLGDTDSPQGVAIPHGNSEYVNKSLVVIIKNKQKLKWNNSFVDKVFIPLISTEDIPSVKNIIKEIYNIIEDKLILENFSDYLIEIKERLKNE